MTTELYIITAQTHLHAGSGDTGYGVVDKMVQRDPLDGLPVIHSSSLKGAFREQVEQVLQPIITTDQQEKEHRKDHPVVEHIFGTGILSTRDTSKVNDNRLAGKYRFHQAYLLSIPVRSNVQPFFRATSPTIIQNLLDKVDLLGITLNAEDRNALEFLVNTGKKLKKGTPIIFTGGEDVLLEDYDAKQDGTNGFLSRLSEIVGADIALFHHDDLKEHCASLPIIARNYLENGISQNLWYEEIVPRETRFYFLLQTTPMESSEKVNGDDPKSFEDILLSCLKPANHLQIGANASVGYGLCQISSLT